MVQYIKIKNGKVSVRNTEHKLLLRERYTI